MSAERKGLLEKGANISKKIDLVTVVGGVLIGSAPAVAFGIVGYLAGDLVEKKLKKRRTG